MPNDWFSHRPTTNRSMGSSEKPARKSFIKKSLAQRLAKVLKRCFVIINIFIILDTLNTD